MKRQVLLRALLIVCILAAVLAITGCVDRGLLDENYIEVESLRIADATVYLSPSGETSKYQLKVDRLPENATNTNLTYYIPSQYLEYVTVDSAGLISAKKEPEEKVRIPLTVTSTSNKKASLIVGLIIEYVEVEGITFIQNNLELDYRSEPIQLGIKYQPYHAQDGRNIIYTSLDPTTATVNASGIVTLLKPGHFTIVAVSKTMSGSEKSAYFNARIKYAKSRFSLEVSDLNPKYKQTIGGPAQTITFTLSSLEPYADPDPRIQWYVSGERVTERDNQIQYPHKPSLSTVGSYNVVVKVLCEGEDEQSFESEKIYIYNDFSGFDFVSANESRIYDNYLYGETVTFDITSTVNDIDHFNWYLKRIGQATQGVLVARTEKSSPNLVKRLNVDGDYALTAVGCDSNDNKIEGQEQIFNFNVTRFVEGDTIILEPRVLNDGIPPESYNWYLYNLDEDGQVISSSTLSNSDSNVVIIGNTLYYKLTKNIDGTIVIKAKGVLDGRVAKVDGIDFIYETKFIKIYPKDNYSLVSDFNDIVNKNDAKNLKYAARTDNTINDLIIDGVYQKDSYAPLVYWNAINGMDAYLVEITNDVGAVMLLNSTEYADNFGDNYCILPTSFVTLKDKFAVRVKQKGGQYTPYYYYAYDMEDGEDATYYFDRIKDNQYSFLKAFTDVVDNGYIRSVKELGEIMDYIILYEPGISANSLVSVTYGVSVAVDDKVEIYDRKYAFKVYLDLNFDDYAAYYPININTDNLNPIYVNLYKTLQGAQNAYCETGDMLVNMDYDEDDGGYYIYLYKNLNIKKLIPPETPGVESEKVTEHYAKIPYGKNNGNFDINNKQITLAWTTDQLYNIAEQGKQPAPQTDVANIVYNKAKSVVNQIIGKDMTDLEKVLAFYDWLILNVEYDKETETANLSNDQAYKYEAFHLEGVFLSYKAVCDGIAKAMSLLCWIEDIPCYKISGYVFNSIGGGAGHAWNKIYIDGEWYIVDATWGGTTIDDSINYKYVMMTDAEFSAYYSFGTNRPIIYGEYERARNNYNYYANTFINGYDTYINSIAELITLLNSYGDTILEDKVVQVRFGDSLLREYTLTQIFGYAKNGITGNKTLADTAKASQGDDTILIITVQPKE
jgi:hypothetical protein